MKKYLKQIKAIKTENDFKDAHITICQACSNYELTWAEFEKLLVAVVHAHVIDFVSNLDHGYFLFNCLS